MQGYGRPPRLGLLAALALAAVGAPSCGASIQAVYEGDVRFEHCMALDARPDVKPTIRRACWEEWAKFYTFGQTRDRIEHAKLRQKQLGGASDFDEADWVPAQRTAALAVPDPTSALAPPPMLLATDAGAPDASSPGAIDPKAKAAAECTGSCDQALALCRQDCKAAPCEKACSVRYKRCTKRCP